MHSLNYSDIVFCILTLYGTFLFKVGTDQSPFIFLEEFVPGGRQNCIVNIALHYTTLHNQYLLHNDALKQKSCLSSLKVT